MDAATRLGHYEIIGPLGAGGMGEVYRARDTSLKREVAIKVLPEALSADPDRLARLEREAHLLAALNHPNIATIHSLEQFEETRFLVLELVPGESLHERLARGSLAVEVALDLCTQIAAALEAAHGEGIIHRDLKPANVLITPDGRAKVLDFGLAKAFEGQTSGDITQSPTLTVAGTQTGVILGTAPYMSPEQARGEPLDKRVDIWAFGCVLYESLTASRAFARATVAETLAAIIETEPNWGALPGATPPMVVALIKRCLRKDPARRLHDIADARIEIEEADEDPDALLPAGVAIAEGRPLWMRVAPWALAGLMALVAGAALYWIATLPDPPGSVHVVALPPDVEFSFVEMATPAFAISPDGSQLVYRVADESEGGDRVYVKHMDQLRGSPIPGMPVIAARVESVAAWGGVFSPDGQEIGFAAEGKLWRAPVSGGTPLPIGDVPGVVRGASWGPDDTIVLGTLANAPHSGLVRVRAQDGALEILTELNADRGELSHRWPQFLPGGKAVVFTVWTGGFFDDAEIAVHSLESGDTKTLPIRGTYPRYVPTGHLLYGRSGSLFAVPFDPDRLEVTGTPRSVLDDLSVDPFMGSAHFAVSDTGTLVYVPRPLLEYELVVFDRAGQARVLAIPPSDYDGGLRFSHDGRYVAASEEARRIYLYDLERDSFTAIPTGGDGTSPLWTPDDNRLIFSSNRGGSYDLFSMPVDGSGPAELLLENSGFQYATSISSNGRVLLYQEQTSGSSWDIMELSLEGDGEHATLVGGPGNQTGAAFSPNARFFAYASMESGQSEVYVRPYPDHLDWRKTISTQSGWGPVWSADGRELFYLQDNRLMVVPVTTEPVFSFGLPRMLFEQEFDAGGYGPAPYDISPDGERFVFRRVSRELPPSLYMKLNWFEELKRLVPTDGPESHP